MSSTDDNDGEIRPISESERKEILEGVSSEMAYWVGAPQRFFAAWKQGVSLAGISYFGEGTKAAFLAATDKNDLAPKRARVEEALGYLSGGERRFLIALYSFYNGRVASEIWREASDAADNMGSITSGIDLQRRKVLADLILNYTGW